MKKNFLLGVLIGIIFIACDSTSQNMPIVVDKSIEVQIIEQVNEIISNEWKDLSIETFAVDSVQVFVDYTRKDSTRRHIYLGLKTKEESLVNRLFSQLKTNFDTQYGKRKCKKNFCSWRKSKSESERLEVMIMNESAEKNYPYLVIEIEEINE